MVGKIRDLAHLPYLIMPSSPRRLHTLALLVYTLLSLALTWPLARYWDHGFMGFARSFQDGIQNVWNMWWMRWALTHGQNPFWNPLLYYPDGLQMYLQTLNAPGTLVALPISLLFGPTAAYNLATIMASTLTGYGVFVLVRNFVPGYRLPLIAGALVLASPFMLGRLLINQINLTSMYWLPFYFLALIRLEERRTWGSLLWAGALVLLLMLTDWYWTLVCLVYTLVWMLTGLLLRTDRGWRVRRYLSFAVVVVLFTSPLLVALAQVRSQLPIQEAQANPGWQAYVRGFSLDAFGLFYPALSPLFLADASAAFIEAVRPRSFSFEGSYTAAGWVLLGLAGVGIWWHGKQHWRLLVTVGVGFLIALGPNLHILGQNTGIPMPYILIEQLPLISTARRPNLYAVPLIIVAALFAALGLQSMIRKLAPQRANALLLGVILLATWELWPPSQRDLYLVNASPLVAGLRERPGAVLDLPYESQESSRSLLHQMYHEQPIVGGYVARRPEYPFLRMPHVGQLITMQVWPELDIVDNAAMLHAAQCYAPLRHILVERPRATPQQIANIEAVLAQIADAPVTPSGQDATTIWYELPPAQTTCQPFLFLGRGWYSVEQDATRSWRWMQNEATIWLVNPHPQPQNLVLELQAETWGEAGSQRMLSIIQNEDPIGTFAVVRQSRRYQFMITLPPGMSPISLRAPASATPDGRNLSLSFRHIGIPYSP
ncbi:hypothetical protein OSCT_0540 [Oscillochloris trichoides DG-6]|uniref:Glycosyltransferase RgtA/B/C/D-like domain-containing protein n=1 Tax=Oscillochloris trichoides DG-6 TaxID=765420 RepID=E1IB39_9CHLR|nr:hypothetical protein [Oscillochloris trichoides]EFO81524.1 hypothetical protein OSCT_0540 [Oscillochloris trichoides DG-6]